MVVYTLYETKSFTIKPYYLVEAPKVINYTSVPDKCFDEQTIMLALIIL